MSDITPDAPVADAPVAEAPAPEVEIDLEGELTQDTFDRPYVEQLRKEAARRRAEAREWQQKHQALYDGFDDPTDVDYLVGLARKLQDDPDATAAEFEAIAKRIREALGGEQPPAAPEAEDDANKPLTKADLDRIEHERAVAHAQAQLLREAESLGYKDGTPEFAQLIWMANNEKEAGRDLQKAHTLILQRLDGLKKAAVEEYIESVRAGNAQFPSVAAPGGGAPAGSPDNVPKDWKSASESALARLNARIGQ